MLILQHLLKLMICNKKNGPVLIKYLNSVRPNLVDADMNFPI